MLFMKSNGVYVPLDEICNTNEYLCPWCGNTYNNCKCKSRTKYTSSILDRKHFKDIEVIKRLLTISGYSFHTFNRVNTYYVDLVSNVNSYKYVIKIIDKDIPYKQMMTETFALSMAKCFVGYIVDYDRFDNLTETNIYKFLSKHYGYITVICDNELYNLYPQKRTNIKIPKITKDFSRCPNGTYYKVLKIEDRFKNNSRR